jgi:hypothetical protein
MTGVKRLAIAALLLLALPRASEARRVRAHFLLDGMLGLTVPFADADFSDAFLPSPKPGVALGVELWLSRRFAIAPEFSLDGAPLFSRRSTGVTTGTLRFQSGLRVLFGFGRGHAFLLRFLFGGEAFIFGPGGRGGAGTTNVGFATEPGLGMQFRFSRRGVAGFLLGFPIGVHTFGTPVTSTDVAFDALGFIGLRL